jgi:hypothetical protein
MIHNNVNSKAWLRQNQPQPRILCVPRRLKVQARNPGIQIVFWFVNCTRHWIHDQSAVVWNLQQIFTDCEAHGKQTPINMLDTSGGECWVSISVSSSTTFQHYGELRDMNSRVPWLANCGKRYQVCWQEVLFSKLLAGFCMNLKKEVPKKFLHI